MNRYILWFDQCSKKDLVYVGGKNASLGEMLQAGIPVPPGFAVTTDAYHDLLAQSDLRSKINQILAPLNVDDIPALEQASKTIRQMMAETPIPPGIEQAIVEAYEKLCADCGAPDLPVAVRSSATAEDLPGASFAGQQDTTLWVRSSGRVIVRTAICWSSLFTARAISYRAQMGFSHHQIGISVGVQKMANAKTAGVMFTLNPVNGDRSKIAVDASWGLGESVVSGVVTPDHFQVDKVTFTIVERTASPKLIEYEPEPEFWRVGIRDVPPERQMQLCLSDEELIALVQLGKRIEKYYGPPQDIEWAIARDLSFPNNLVILQSRPETFWSQKKAAASSSSRTGVEGVADSLLAGVRIRARE